MKSPALIILSSGEESFLSESDIECDLAFTTVDKMVEAQTIELLESRKDWSRDTVHVKEFRDRMRAFYSKFQPGDRLVEFCTSPATWMGMAGRAGYLILRGNKIAAHYTTRMN